MTTNENRPPGFDAALTAYLPGLNRQARYMTRNALLAQDLVQDTVVEMLRRADKCRMETFKTWACLVMRQVAADQRTKARTQKRSAVTVDHEDVQLPTAPAQLDSLELSQTLRQLSTIPYGSALLRRAMGDGLREIGNDNGTTKEAVRQNEVKARTALRKRMKRA
jgi:RNA polymerase sigma factor (sigma-70 family)